RMQHAHNPRPTRNRLKSPSEDHFQTTPVDQGLARPEPSVTPTSPTRRTPVAGRKWERAAREYAGTELDGIERTTNAAAEQISAYAERMSTPTTRDATEQLLARRAHGTVPAHYSTQAAALPA
ncbi:hypothetical protein ACWF95_40885, partial [Streptomyces vinaceus]